MSGVVGLSEEEEKRILLLLEGDISDIEIEEDDNVDEAEEEELIRLRTIVDPDPVHIDLNILNISVEKEKDKTPRDDDDDNIPLAILFPKKQGKPIKRKVLWKKTHLDDVDTTCNISYTPTEDILTPLGYFNLMFDDAIIENIVDQTNLYSVQKFGSSVNTNITEIWAFLGIQILSGIVRMPSYRMYWAQETRFPPIADIMSRNRFDKLRNCIHLNNNDNVKPREDINYDKLFKVRPFIDALKSNFSKIEPEENHSVDEMMIPFKGRHTLKQYVQNKPHKWGIKVFARTGISGILYDFEIYVGKGTIQIATPLGISGDIVVRLVEGIPKYQNFKVFMDNWFSSLELFCHLKEIGLFCTGTVRINRMPGCKLMPDIDLKKNGRGSYDYSTESNNNITVTKWYDNKIVHVASSYKSTEPVELVKRWSTSHKQYIDVTRPAVVKEYNLNMGGVDLNDMLVSLYRIKLGVKRYYLRIVYHFIDICIVNAWLLYRRHCTEHKIIFKRLVVFRSEIAHALINKNSSFSKKRGRPMQETSTPEPPSKRRVTFNPIDDIRYDNVDHWPTHLDTKNRCRNCIKAYSRVACMKCKVPLCLTKDKNCFYLFHKK